MNEHFGAELQDEIVQFRNSSNEFFIFGTKRHHAIFEAREIIFGGLLAMITDRRYRLSFCIEFSGFFFTINNIITPDTAFKNKVAFFGDFTFRKYIGVFFISFNEVEFFDDINFLIS